MCTGGGCCSGGTCLARGEGTGATVCVDGNLVTCGGGGQPCCATDSCSGKRCCVDGQCVMFGGSCGTAALGMCNNGTCSGCGSDGQTCCTGALNGMSWSENFCVASGDACNSQDKCSQCGGSGQPCCDGNSCNGGGCCDRSTRLCVGNGSMCGGGTGACKNGACGGGTCGGPGLPCCTNNVECTAPYTSCQNNTCAGCGGPNEPCCPGANAGGYWCSVGLACQPGAGTCTPCGGSNQICCAGAVCGGGMTCNGQNQCM